MSLGPIAGGIIDSLLPVEYFYLVMLVVVPVILLIYLANRRKLNQAVIQHQQDVN